MEENVKARLEGFTFGKVQTHQHVTIIPIIDGKSLLGALVRL